MANNNDFINSGTQISGTDISIQPGASGGTRFLSTFLGGLMNSGGGQESKMKKEKDKLTYYTELRQAGYSADEASKRVNKQFTGGFMSKILGKTNAGFQPPASGTDTLNAKAEELKASAKLKGTQADWFARRSGSDASGGKSGTGDTERIKSLQTMLQKTQDDIDAAVTANKPQDGLRKRLDKYQKAYDKLVGADDSASVQGNESPTGGYVPGQTQVGQTFKHSNGKTYKVVGISDPNDPDVEEA